MWDLIVSVPDHCLYFTLCGFVVFTARCFVLNLALLFVLVFFSPLSKNCYTIIVITSLVEEIAGLCASRAR